VDTGTGRRDRRWLAAIAIVVAVALLLAGAGAPQPVGPSQVAGATPNRELNALWQRYGDDGGQWSGADGTTSISLPDGRTAWLFSDTFLGEVNDAHCRPRTAPLVRNSIVVQDGRRLTTHPGGKDRRLGLPTGILPSATPENWYWVADGTVEGDKLRVFYNRYRSAGHGPLGFGPAGTVLATLSLPDLTVRGMTTVPGTARVLWGSAVVEDAGYTYVYGSEIGDQTKFAHLARARTGELTRPWEYWTGDGWSRTEARSRRLMSGVGTGFSVDRIGGRYVLVTQETNAVLSPHLVAYFAHRPTGPFSGPTYLYRAPEPGGQNRIVYDARLHPQLSTPNRLVVSYNVNTLAPDETHRDARIYRPRFIDITLRSAGPDPATLPRRPRNLTAEPRDGGVRLRWDPLPGDVSYWVYQRDVSAGQTAFGRLPTPVSGASSLDIGYLRPGHEYEHRVTAVSRAGESRPSRSVTIRVAGTAPLAPSGLRATPRPDGRVYLAWTAPTGGAPGWFTVAQRDLSAGQARFAPRPLPVNGGTSVIVDHLVSGHRYEFRVAAANLAGTSTAEQTVTAVASRQPGVPSPDDDPCPAAR
jgi:hypothetical protein